MYLIYVAQLRGPFSAREIQNWSKWSRVSSDNPRHFYVGIKTGELPNLNLLRKNGPRPMRKYGWRILENQTAQRTRRAGALFCQETIIKALRDKGQVVANPPPPRSYSVYVFELNPSIGKKQAVRRLNPSADPEKPVVYVGQTGKSPEERFEEHRSGERRGRHYQGADCIRLLPGLYHRFNPMTELQSLKRERRLAYALRKQGYTVLGGH